MKNINCYLVIEGKHSEIIANRNDLLSHQFFLDTQLPDNQFYRFGWGDAEYYGAPEKTLGMVIRALFTPTPSVLEITGMDQLPASARNRRVLTLSLDDTMFSRLLDFISSSYEVDELGEHIMLKFFQQEYYFKAKNKYHLLNTCNNWTAQGLHHAGLPINYKRAILSSSVYRQIKKRARDFINTPSEHKH